uniref:PTM/DIR17-like Tudor domain-containing protein n=1 Tax=Odontella aurita TaxID=265563 RepID=A0A7S4IZC2_9STRA|mmetsp:Transcript_33839/g.100998  ORF Transcript_33839/g.100998 Transcript_33839/m.100998 type:complete len:255 (+) Transcript_33839:180-944(+)
MVGGGAKKKKKIVGGGAKKERKRSTVRGRQKKTGQKFAIFGGKRQVLCSQDNCEKQAQHSFEGMCRRHFREAAEESEEANDDEGSGGEGDEEEDEGEEIVIGTKMLKTFDGMGDFEGTVVKVPSKGSPFYKVRYDDGDEEDLDEDELRSHISYWKKRRKAKAEESVESEETRGKNEDDDDEDDDEEEEEEEGIVVGTKMLKTFYGLGDFEGTVVKVPSKGSTYYKVKYGDGDEEDLDDEELRSHISYWKKERDY